MRIKIVPMKNKMTMKLVSKIIKGPSMSFYPDFIQILSRFYPDFFKNKLYPDFILIFEKNLDKIWIKLEEHFMEIVNLFQNSTSKVKYDYFQSAFSNFLFHLQILNWNLRAGLPYRTIL
jgi:hypothetical protein